jgi:hypothetical protein
MDYFGALEVDYLPSAGTSTSAFSEFTSPSAK